MPNVATPPDGLPSERRLDPESRFAARGPRRRCRRALVACLVVLAMPLFSCAGKRPSNLGVEDGRLVPCPSTPNCVSSDATDEGHRIEPFTLAVEPGQAWEQIRETVAALPRTTVITASEGYLHAECTSALMGFVDDLELQLRAGEGIVAVRSASRLGRSDLGVNRKRVEGLRETLRAEGVLR
jgi:uncharacterized protein (DUF1499 family)